MTRRFFDQIEDEVRGLLGPSWDGLTTSVGASLLKIWFGERWLHFEAQLVSRRWAPRRRTVIEVGLHLESSSRERNEQVLESLVKARRRWEKKLPDAVTGKALGPQSATWRRLSEVMDVEDADDPDLAGEIAERLATYVKTLRPLIRNLVLDI